MNQDTVQRLQVVLLFLYSGKKTGATVELVSDIKENYIYTCLNNVKNEMSVTWEEVCILLYNDLIEIESGFGLGPDVEREIYQLSDEGFEKIEYILKSKSIQTSIALPK
jgi:hypothetical protein